MQKYLADILSVLALTMSAEGELVWRANLVSKFFCFCWGLSDLITYSACIWSCIYDLLLFIFIDKKRKFIVCMLPASTSSHLHTIIIGYY